MTWLTLLKTLENLIFCNDCIYPSGGSVAPQCSSAVVPLTSWLGELHRHGSDLSLSKVFAVFPPLVFQGSSAELFGEMFQNLPRLNSDFLNTSWQTSRNIPTPKTLAKDISTPSSTPEPLSEVTPSPALSPRSLSKSPQSPRLSSKQSSRLSSPHSHSSNSFLSKSSTAVSSKSKSKELPSPFLSPKSITKPSPYIPVSPKKKVKIRLHGVTAAKKVLIENQSSPLSPQELCSPTRPSSDISINHPSEEELPASPQTGIFNL